MPVSGYANDQVLAELVEQLSVKLSTGDSAAVQGFIAAHAERAEALRALIPTLQMLVDVGSGPALNRSSLGPSRGVDSSGADRHTVLGDFRILRQVGQGGMGVVYEAEQISLRRRVALKVLPTAAMLDPRALQRFRNEAQAAAALHHRQIVPIYGVGCERGVHYYAMQYVDGLTLAEVIGQLRGQSCRTASHPGSLEPTLSLAESPNTSPAGTSTAHGVAETEALAALSTETSPNSAAWFRRIAQLFSLAADGLHHAHELGVTHRDIKPANLMFDRLGHIWITDFGLARIEGAGDLTVTGDLLGTLRYMSPEQALAQRIGVDHRTDIYSLGVTLYELVTLRPAIAGHGRQELLRQIAFEEPLLPRKHNPAIPRDLETIVMKAIQKNPAERYLTAAEMAADLQRFVEDRHIQARRPSLAVRVARFAKRHRAALSAAGVALFLATAAVLGWAYDHHRRLARATALVNDAMQEAALRHVAAETTGDNLIAWEQAVAAAEKAVALADSGRVTPEIVKSAHDHSAQIKDAQEQARRRVTVARKDAQMLADLKAARMASTVAVLLGPMGSSFDIQKSSDEFHTAFANYGIDFARQKPGEIAALIKGSTIRDALRTALVFWVMYNTLDQPTITTLATIVEQSSLDDEGATWQTHLMVAFAHTNYTFHRATVRSMVADSHENTSADNAECLALLLIRLKDDSAITYIKTALRNHPDNFFLNYWLSYLLRADSRHDRSEVLRYAYTAVAIAPTSPGAWQNLGLVLAECGDRHHEAIAACLAAIRLQPSLVDARMNLAELLRRCGFHKASVEFLGEFIESEPGAAQAYSRLARLFEEQHELYLANVLYRAALRLDPTNVECNIAYMQFLHSQDELDEAIRHCHRVAESAPSCAARCHTALAQILIEYGYSHAAETTCLETLLVNPSDPWAYDALGYVLQREGRTGEAEQALLTAIRLAPSEAHFYFRLGSVLHDVSDRMDEAIEAYRKAIQLDVWNTGYHRNLGIVLTEVGDSVEAAKEYRWVLRRDPADWEMWASLGWELNLLEEFDESIAAYQEALRLQPRDARIYEELCNPLANRGDLDQALHAVRRAIELQPDLDSAYVALAWALNLQGDYVAATAASREAIRLNPNRSIAHRRLGDSLAGEDKAEAAEAAYREALRLAPRDAIAHVRLGEVLSWQHKYDEATAAVRESIRLEPSSVSAQQFLEKLTTLAKLNQEYENILAGRTLTPNACEPVELADFALAEKHAPEIALRLFTQAFAEDQALLDDIDAGYRYNAACAAMLTASNDDRKVDEAERVKLIHQALAWLEDDLNAIDKATAGEAPDELRNAVNLLEHWSQDPDLSTIRDRAQRERLSPELQAPCRKLWSDHADLLQRLKRQLRPSVIK